MEQDYWVLPLKDGTELKIPAAKVKDINIRLDNKQPIKAENRTVLWQDIASGPRKYTPLIVNSGLAEQAAVVFNEPMLSDDNEVRCVWVKEEATTDRWNKYYANFAGYHKLSSGGDRITIAYRLPIHSVDSTTLKCTPDESKFLQSKLEQR